MEDVILVQAIVVQAIVVEAIIVQAIVVQAIVAAFSASVGHKTCHYSPPSLYIRVPTANGFISTAQLPS